MKEKTKAKTHNKIEPFGPFDAVVVLILILFSLICLLPLLCFHSANCKDNR